MPIPKQGVDTTREYNELLVTTLEHIHPGIRENAIDAHPIVSMMMGKIGSVMQGPIGQDGAPGPVAEQVSGESIRTNAKLGTNDSFSWLSTGYDEIGMDTTDNLRGGRSNFKLGAGSVVISGDEKRKNSGDAQVASLLLTKEQDTVSAAVEEVARALLATSESPHAVTSLDSLISSNDSVQGLSGARYEKWNSRGLSPKGTLATDIEFTPTNASFAASGAASMRAAWMNAEEGSIAPKMILTTDQIHQYYEGSLTPDVRYTSLAVGDIGFQALQFKLAPVFHDPFCATGTMYFLNPDYLKVKHLPGALFNLSEMRGGQNQDAFVAHLIFQANLCTDGRKFQNKITGITG